MRRSRTLVLTLVILSLLLNTVPLTMAQSNSSISLDSLKEGSKANGFRAEAVYLNDSDKPFGARLRHERTGFTFDYLELQSVPQAFLWVNSYPTSDMGEPHTQEHLLLGKGNRGRAHSSLEGMTLVGSSAFTQQWRTAYHLHTGAGAEVFYKVFESQVDSLLHPDYTDEEIRREVRNWGVSENPADKTLRLEERGTVYQEMVSSFDRPISRLFRAVNQALYGKTHPLAVSSGGFPSSIREMRAEDIRKFHADNYHLGNMGMVASFPKEMPLADVLRRTDDILNRLEPNPPKRKYLTESDLPAPEKLGAAKVEAVVDYPHKNEQQPGWIMLAWPAQLKLDAQDEILLGLFLQNFAGDATTNLYKKFVDTKTREIETGAKGVFGFVDSDQGNPVMIGLTDVTPANMTPEKMSAVREKVLAELARVASLPDGSPELVEFNTRLMNRVTERRRDLSKFVNSPPGFGFRGSSSAWMEHLRSLEKIKGFRKSVTLKAEMAEVEKLLGGGKNVWRERLAGWKLTASTPLAFASRPSPQLIADDERERKERADAELARLKTVYKTDDAQEALRRYKADYDKTTAELERLAGQAATPRFVDNPPLTLDDQLDFKVSQVGGVPLVVSTFDNMTSATTGLALRLDTTPEDELVYLSVLPALIRQTGVVRDGKAISFEEMSELLRKEVLSLDTYFSTNFRTGRAELVVRGAGNDAAESQRALAWMRLLLASPNWTKENLPRIRDVVDQQLSGLRNRTQGSEESWVNDPADAYWRQDNPLLLSTGSFLTRAHNAHRLRWMLKDAGAGDEREAISNFLTRLSGAGHLNFAPGKPEPTVADLARYQQERRVDLKALLAWMQGKQESGAKVPPMAEDHARAFGQLSAGAKAVAVEAARDLDQVLADIPDSSLAADWEYLVRQIRHDLLQSPEKTLADLNNVRQRLLKTGGARLFQTGSRQTQQQLAPQVGELLATLTTGPSTPVNYSNTRLVEGRLRARAGAQTAPVFVGLLQPSLSGGVFLNSAPLVTYADTSREALLDYLASRLYAGRGAHGIFIKTWGAGLAYSNGFRGSPAGGRIGYYAERTPELPQTLRFVIDELKRAPRDASLAEYAVAQAFAEFRSAQGYEQRGEAMAADLADGVTPEQVRRFRQAVLALRTEPKLAEELFNRMAAVYARVLPGYATKAGDVRGGVFFTIGSEKQLTAYEQYLKTVEGADAQVFRLYPRDYWMTLRDEGQRAGGEQ